MNGDWADTHGEQPMSRSQFEAEEERAELNPDAEAEWQPGAPLQIRHVTEAEFLAFLRGEVP
jgi:hypothetical protein